MNIMKLEFFTDNKNFPFFIQYGEHNTELYMHKHADFSELVIVMSGTAVHIVDDEEYFIERGDVFVISHNTAHGYKNTHDFKICNIMYQPSNIFEDDSDIKKSSGFHALFVIEPFLAQHNGFQSQLKLCLSEFSNIKNITQLMFEEYQNNYDGRITILKSLFTILATYLSRLYNFTDKSKDKSTLNIAKTVAYIEKHFNENILTNQLAEMINLSPRHFNRLFVQTYNTTPYKYLISLRIQQACNFLKNTNKNVSEIAIECGFSDSNYFSRQFKKVTNTSPLEYRKTHI